jgi:hypothetical protein
MPMSINTGGKYLHSRENARSATEVHDPRGSSIIRERPISHELPPRGFSGFEVGKGSLEPVAEALGIDGRQHSSKIE